MTLQAPPADVGKPAGVYVKVDRIDIGDSFMLVGGNSFLRRFVPATTPLEPFIGIPLPANESVTLYSGTITTPGKYAIYMYYQTADGKREKATSVLTVRNRQTLEFTNLPTIAPKVGEKFDLSSSVTARWKSNNPITLKSDTADVCSLEGSTLTFLAEGICHITAQQDANEFLTFAEASADIQVQSAGVFSLSITDKDKQPISNILENQPLNIALEFKAPASAVGKPALAYLKVTTNSAGSFNLTSKGLEYTTSSSLQPIIPEPLPLPASYTLPLYSGTLPVIGTYTVYAKYQTTDKQQWQEASASFNVRSVYFASAFLASVWAGQTTSYAEWYATGYEYAVYFASVYPEYYSLYADIYTKYRAKGYSHNYAKQVSKFYVEAYGDAKNKGMTNEDAALDAKNAVAKYGAESKDMFKQAW